MLQDILLPCFEGARQPYESVISAIETLHFTSSTDPSSITVLGRNQFCPVDL
jgi:hypothetical protein